LQTVVETRAKGMRNVKITKVPRINISVGMALYIIEFKVDNEMTAEQEKALLKNNIEKLERAFEPYKQQGEEIHAFLGISRVDGKTGKTKKAHGHGFVLAAKASARAKIACGRMNKDETIRAINFKVSTNFGHVMNYHASQCNRYRTYSANGELDWDTIINASMVI
jgi:hypothetical protein